MSGEEIKEEQAGANRGDVPPGAAVATAIQIASDLIKNAAAHEWEAHRAGATDEEQYHSGVAAGVHAVMYQAFGIELDGA